MAKVLAAIRQALTFRVVVALVASTGVTASVSGPLAYQASKAREQPPVAAAPTTTTSPPPTLPGETTTSTTTTTTSTTTTTAAVTTTTVLSSTGLFASNSRDHADRLPLDGLGLIRVMWVFFDGPGTTSVRYWVDDPTGSGPPDQVATSPFDLAPEGYNAAPLGAGTHTLLAEVTTVNGRFRRLATFTVVV